MMFLRNKLTLLAAAFGAACHIGLTSAGNTNDYCYDDPDYVWHGKDCEEIADSNYCAVELGDGDIIGEVYCPVSCDMCEDEYDESYLRTSKDCYRHAEDIVASFANVDPHKSDAVAIWPYDEEDPVHYSTQPVLWKWLCYGDGSNCLSYYGEIVLNEYADGEWPLPKGYYIIILKKGGEFVFQEMFVHSVVYTHQKFSWKLGPLEDIKASDIFEVGDCGYPAPHPVSRPTPKPVSKPTPKPTFKPSSTDSPTEYPTYKPYPTSSPTEYPTDKPYHTDSPTEYPTYKPDPTYSPTEHPTDEPKPTPKPTPHPTKKPTPHPTPSKSKPTSYPTHEEECTSSLTTDMDCYDGSYDVVVVDFKICYPHIKDWIGIFHASDDPNDLGEAVAWAWTACGSMHDCEESSDDDSLDTNGYVEFIGLPDGEYRAHLINHSDPYSSGFEAEASSGIFYVEDECVY
jgi:hypothetical protein